MKGFLFIILRNIFRENNVNQAIGNTHKQDNLHSNGEDKPYTP